MSSTKDKVRVPAVYVQQMVSESDSWAKYLAVTSFSAKQDAAEPAVMERTWYMRAPRFISGKVLSPAKEQKLSTAVSSERARVGWSPASTKVIV